MSREVRVRTRGTHRRLGECYRQAGNRVPCSRPVPDVLCVGAKVASCAPLPRRCLVHFPSFFFSFLFFYYFPVFHVFHFSLFHVFPTFLNIFPSSCSCHALSSRTHGSAAMRFRVAPLAWGFIVSNLLVSHLAGLLRTIELMSGWVRTPCVVDTLARQKKVFTVVSLLGRPQHHSLAHSHSLPDLIFPFRCVPLVRCGNKQK